MWTIYDEHGHNLGETSSKLDALNTAKMHIANSAMYITLYSSSVGISFRVYEDVTAPQGVRVETINSGM